MIAVMMCTPLVTSCTCRYAVCCAFEEISCLSSFAEFISLSSFEEVNNLSFGLHFLKSVGFLFQIET
jgi:hypothetical protein